MYIHGMNGDASSHTQLDGNLVASPKKDLQFAYFRTSIYRDGMYRFRILLVTEPIFFFPDKNQIGKKNENADIDGTIFTGNSHR